MVGLVESRAVADTTLRAASSVEYRRRFNLDEELGPRERLDADERAGGCVLTKEVASTGEELSRISGV